MTLFHAASFFHLPALLVPCPPPPSSQATCPDSFAFLYIFVVLLFFPLLSSCFWVLKPSIPPSFRNHSRGRCLFCNDVFHCNAFDTWCKTSWWLEGGAADVCSGLKELLLQTFVLA